MTKRREPLIPGMLRPNGKVYCPRKLRSVVIEEEIYMILVLGTHDLAVAREIADRRNRENAYGIELDEGRPGWWRHSIRGNDPWWVPDEVRGAAGVMFEGVN